MSGNTILTIGLCFTPIALGFGAWSIYEAAVRPTANWTYWLAGIWAVGPPIYFFVEHWLMKGLILVGEDDRMVRFIQRGGDLGFKVWAAIGAIILVLLER